MTRRGNPARGRGRFCSRQCQGAAGGKETNRRHPQAGEGNHCYKHGLSMQPSLYTQMWQANNPEKHAAHQFVQWMVRSGRLVKPDACEQCGRAVPLDGHHDDYTKKAQVRWLCRKCHRAHHNKVA